MTESYSIHSIVQCWFNINSKSPNKTRQISYFVVLSLFIVAISQNNSRLLACYYTLSLKSKSHPELNFWDTTDVSSNWGSQLNQQSSQGKDLDTSISLMRTSILKSLSSPLRSKAMFLSGFYIFFWRALSCQQTPFQALNPTRKITKEENYKIHNKIE